MAAGSLSLTCIYKLTEPLISLFTFRHKISTITHTHTFDSFCDVLFGLPAPFVKSDGRRRRVYLWKKGYVGFWSNIWKGRYTQFWQLRQLLNESGRLREIKVKKFENFAKVPPCSSSCALAPLQVRMVWPWYLFATDHVLLTFWWSACLEVMLLHAIRYV